MTQDQKEKNRNHREEFHKSREPLLNGLTSQYDLDLFREAQNRASEEMVGAVGSCCCFFGGGYEGKAAIQVVVAGCFFFFFFFFLLLEFDLFFFNIFT